MAKAATMSVRALVAFGRNDIRGTYRDPLLVMIVIAPVIWTTGGRGADSSLHPDAR
jgi:fluoroquinolone transport system permease protein